MLGMLSATCTMRAGERVESTVLGETGRSSGVVPFVETNCCSSFPKRGDARAPFNISRADAGRSGEAGMGEMRGCWGDWGDCGTCED